jgi:sugar lactone lactonase YvrE
VGTAARFSTPYGIAFSAPCNCLYVADNGNHTIRKVLLDGTVTTFGGRAGVQGSNNGTGSGALFKGPGFVAADGSGNVYVTEMGSYSVRKITAAAVVTTLAGTSYTSGEADGSAAAALFNSPNGLACDDAGNVYVADYWGPTIRKITPAGVVSTIVGQAGVYGGSMEGTGAGAQMLEPW